MKSIGLIFIINIIIIIPLIRDYFTGKMEPVCAPALQTE